MVGREGVQDLAAKVAEIGAALCCYAPGHGDPERWPTSKCDCKYGATGRGEQTGCPEARALYRMLTPAVSYRGDFVPASPTRVLPPKGVSEDEWIGIKPQPPKAQR